MTHIQIIISIIISCGLIGGLANYLVLYQPNKSRLEIKIALLKSLVLGICASSTVPLFLQIITNNLLDNPTGNYQEKNYFILIGFCILASIYSKRFLNDLYTKVNQLENKSEKALEKASEAEKYIVEQLNKESEDPDPLKFEISNIENIIINKENLISNKMDEYLKKGLDKEMEILLKDFQNSNYKDRSIEGLSKSTKIDVSKIEKIIDIFLKEKIIAEVIWFGKITYRLTEHGKIVNF